MRHVREDRFVACVDETPGDGAGHLDQEPMVSPFVLENELYQVPRLGSGGLLRETLVATEDRALLFTVSGQQFDHVTDIRARSGAPESFPGPVKCVVHVPIVADLGLEGAVVAKGDADPASFDAMYGPLWRPDAARGRSRSLWLLAGPVLTGTLSLTWAHGVSPRLLPLAKPDGSVGAHRRGRCPRILRLGGVRCGHRPLAFHYA